MAVTCGNCGNPADAEHAFCGRCGQKLATGRLSLHAIGHDLVHLIAHVDRSAFSLVRLLLTQPGVVARNYVQGMRKRYFGPFAFLFVAVAVTSAAVAFSGFEAVMSDSPNKVGEFLQHHVNIVMFAEVPLLAAFSRLLDGRGGRNLAEHLVLAAYTTGLRLIFVALVVIPVWLAFRHRPDTARILYYIYLPLWPAYFGFASLQFRPDEPKLACCKGVLSAILAWISLQAMAVIVTSVYQQVFVAG